MINRKMTSAVTFAAVLLAHSLTLSEAQSSCKGRCGGEYNRGSMCQCDYSCLAYGECCQDYEYQCTTRNSCKGRCGETFKRGRLCSCDPDCIKFKQCCSDVSDHCDADEMGAVASAAEPGKANSCQYVNDNKPKEPALKDATEATFSEGNEPDDFFPEISPSAYPNGDQDSYSPLDDYFPNDGMKELEPSSTLAPDPLGPQSRDDGPQDNGILSSSPPPNGVMPTEATPTTAQPQADGQATEQSLKDSTPEALKLDMTSGDLPEVTTTALNPPEATASASPTQPPDTELEATGKPLSSTQEPASILEGTSPSIGDEQDNGEDVTNSPLPQDSDDQATTTTTKPNDQGQGQYIVEAELEATPSIGGEQENGEDVTNSPLPQDIDDQATTTTTKPNDQGQGQYIDEAELEGTPSTGDTQTSTGDDAKNPQDIDDQAATTTTQPIEDTKLEATSSTGDTKTTWGDVTKNPQDIDDQAATTTTQPIDQGQDDTKDDPAPEATPTTGDTLTNGDGVTSTTLHQDVEDRKIPTTTKPSDQGLDVTTDGALPEATPEFQTGAEDVTKKPTHLVQDGTTADDTAEVPTVNPLNVTPEPTKAPPKPQDKPVPATVLPDKTDQDRPSSKPQVRPLKPAGSTDDTTGYQGDASNDTNLCSGQPVSAVTTLRNGTIVVFRGHYFWVLDRNLVPSPARGITQVWGVPSPIDTVFTRCNCQGKTYIFKGPLYWRFENNVLDSGYPKPIATGFDGLRGHITAALSVPQYQRRGESVYFFKRGGLVQKYSYQFGTAPTCGRKPQHSIYTIRNRMARQAVSNLGPTINIRRSWRGFPTTVTAAVSIPTRRQPEGYKYFVFSRTKVYNVRMEGESPVVAAATASAGNAASQNNFFKCPKKV